MGQALLCSTRDRTPDGATEQLRPVGTLGKIGGIFDARGRATGITRAPSRSTRRAGCLLASGVSVENRIQAVPAGKLSDGVGRRAGAAKREAWDAPLA
jgi:hypothetical protein